MHGAQLVADDACTPYNEYLTDSEASRQGSHRLERAQNYNQYLLQF